MTEEELGASIVHMRSDISTLMDEWTQFLKIEADKRATNEQNAVAATKKEASDSATKWEKNQTFLKKHGPKLLGLAFTAVTAGLTWYGSLIRSEINAEQQAVKIDADIAANKESIEATKVSFDEFKTTTGSDIEDIRLGDIEQTIMMESGFDRLGKAMITAHPRQLPDEDALPKPDESFTTTAKAARTDKAYYDRHGKLPKKKKKKPAN